MRKGDGSWQCPPVPPSESLSPLEAWKDGSFDLVLSLLDAHWIQDVPMFLKAVGRCLAPGGLFFCVFFGDRTLHELRTCFINAESDLYGRCGARTIPMMTLEEGMKLMGQAHFQKVVGDRESLNVLSPSLKELFHFLTQMGERNALAARQPLSKRLLEEVKKRYEKDFFAPTGELIATFDLITLTGWKKSLRAADVWGSVRMP